MADEIMRQLTPPVSIEIDQQDNTCNQKLCITILPAMFHRSGFANSSSRFTSVDFNATFVAFAGFSTGGDDGALSLAAEELVAAPRTNRRRFSGVALRNADVTRK